MLLIKRDGFIYEVNQPRVLDSRKISLSYALELICGYDYINPDLNDIQGWVSPNMFIDEVQSSDIMVYWDESLKDRIIEEGYEIIGYLPKIHVIKIIE